MLVVCVLLLPTLSPRPTLMPILLSSPPADTAFDYYASSDVKGTNAAGRDAEVCTPMLRTPCAVAPSAASWSPAHG